MDDNQRFKGPANTLATLGVLLYFPVRPVGIQSKIIIQGLLSAVIGSAWCFLGNFLANCARDPAVETPLQVSSSVVSAVFCFVLIFIMGYVRAKYPQADFATVFASMIASFALTQNAALPGFESSSTFTFLKPILFSTAISFVVNILIWPEDSVSNYLDVLTDVLEQYNTFFQENATDFFRKEAKEKHDIPAAGAKTTSLAMLRTTLQASFIKLVDTQHEIKHAVLYHQLSHQNIVDLTRHVRSLHAPLHGIGVSVICKSKDIIDPQGTAFSNRGITLEIGKDLENSTFELIESCKIVLQECKDRVSIYFKQANSSVWSTFLWPFPRLFYSSQIPALPPTSINRLYDAIVRHLHTTSRKRTSQANILTYGYLEGKQGQLHQQNLQLPHLLQFNLLSYANSLHSLATYLSGLDPLLPKKIRLPRTSLRSWLRPSSGDTANVMGGKVNDRKSVTESYGGLSSPGDTESSIGCVDSVQDDGDVWIGNLNLRNKTHQRDPDVDAPVTKVEHFFNYVGKVFDWFYSMETLFALKTAVSFIILSLPAYLPQSVDWYTGWGGQWVANTLIMWIFPMAGTFNFTVVFGLLGTVIGAVLSIIVWEIARGNPYGIAVLTFFAVFIPFEYLLIVSRIYEFLAIMTLYAYLMIITTGYQNAVGDELQGDSIEMAAGKRLLFVVLGIICACIVNWFPRPVTCRVELRKRISKTFYDLSILYGAIFASILTSNDVSLRVIKDFEKLALGIQRQLKDEETYLRLSKLEPPLKGKFPYDIYSELIERLNNMAYLIEGMGFAAVSMDKTWRSCLIEVFNEDIVDYVACFMNMMRILSGTLISKTALPPYTISPNNLKEKLDRKLCITVRKYPEQLYNDTFSSFCAYSIASSKFTEELIEASECVERLVGVDNPADWLRNSR
ncbi:hypothetical protein MFLAVUS_003771 [Mucor flavus]|uniref:DUF2421 domain-containing protein n=1 Tax=Mucor flavus TaxID=439312 RepID=A0ABP9YU45_9FUNG